MALEVYARGWRERVDREMASDPDYVAGLHEVLQGLNSARTDPPALHGVVSQPWGKKRFDWYDAAGMYEVALHLQAGLCVALRVDLGQRPGRDREEATNQAKLDTLPAPFNAWCASGNADDDGRLEWASEIGVAHEVDGGERIVVAYPPSGVPIEIGYTEPETTVFHLVRDGGVARWPYGHESMTVLLSTRFAERYQVALKRPRVISGADWLATRSEALDELMAASTL